MLIFKVVKLQKIWRPLSLGCCNTPAPLVPGGEKYLHYTLPHQKHWNNNGISFQNFFKFLDGNIFL